MTPLALAYALALRGFWTGPSTSASGSGTRRGTVGPTRTLRGPLNTHLSCPRHERAGGRARLPIPLELLVASCLLIGILAGVSLARSGRARAVDRSRRLGARGSERALRLLRRKGYRIERLEAAATVHVLVDGRREEYGIRADAIVRRRRRTYVAEIKAGLESATLANRFTRRQLLEYARAFQDADGLLLVDAHRGRIHRVEFPDYR